MTLLLNGSSLLSISNNVHMTMNDNDNDNEIDLFRHQ